MGVQAESKGHAVEWVCKECAMQGVCKAGAVQWVCKGVYGSARASVGVQGVCNAVGVQGVCSAMGVQRDAVQ